MLTVVDNGLAVDNDRIDTLGVMVGITKYAHFPDILGIENDDIGKGGGLTSAFADPSIPVLYPNIPLRHENRRPTKAL